MVMTITFLAAGGAAAAPAAVRSARTAREIHASFRIAKEYDIEAHFGF